MLKPTEPLQATKTGELVAGHIRRQIARGEVGIGERLPSEDELATMYGVARTSLREALRILESQGLVQIKRGRAGGATVTAPELRHLAQTFALSLQIGRTTVGDLDYARLMIEPQIAGMWAERHADEDLAALASAADTVADAAACQDLDAFGRAAAEFHNVLMERSANRTLRTIGALLNEIVQRHLARVAVLSDEDQMRRAVRSYRRLIRLISEHEIDGAIEHWRRQIRFTMSAVDGYNPLDLFED